MPKGIGYKTKTGAKKPKSGKTTKKTTVRKKK